MDWMSQLDLAWVSLAALFVVIVVSCTTAINPGVLSIVFAWLIGVYLSPQIGLKTVLAGFPTDLFLNLVGITLLFTQAQVNGTLDRVGGLIVRGCRGNAGLIPIMYFVMTCGFSSIGAGSIASTALMAPVAMATAQRTGIPAFLMTIMIAHGAIAGGMSPFAMTGIIADGLIKTKLGLENTAWLIYGHNLFANAAVALGGYLLFGGWRLFRRNENNLVPKLPLGNADEEGRSQAGVSERETARFESRHWATLMVVACLIVGVIFFKVHVGMAGFAGAMVLTLLRMADEKEAVRQMPWGVILMVCGVSVLTALLEKTGGTERFTHLVGRVSTPATVTAIVAFLTGLVSVYSSTSGVVLPAFLPLVPGLVEKLGGGNPIAIASSIIIGGNLVDSSPLSTIGALCVACAPATEDRRILFNKVLAWGLSMAVAGAAGCYLFFGAQA